MSEARYNQKLMLKPEFYFHDKRKKTLIILHHTVSDSVQNIKPTFEVPHEHISVAYAIEKNGTVYQLFEDPGDWGYSIGGDFGGLDGFRDSSNAKSIAIEIANEGPLYWMRDEDAGKMAWYWSPKQDKYVLYGENRMKSIGYQGEHPVTLDTPYRGFATFASYTEKQYVALFGLLDYLFDKFPTIPRKFINHFDYKRFDVLAGYKGVVSHVNLRLDKTDLSPAFDIKRLNEHIVGKKPKELPKVPTMTAPVKPLNCHSTADNKTFDAKQSEDSQMAMQACTNTNTEVLASMTKVITTLVGLFSSLDVSSLPKIGAKVSKLKDTVQDMATKVATMPMMNAKAIADIQKVNVPYPVPDPSKLNNISLPNDYSKSLSGVDTSSISGITVPKPEVPSTDKRVTSIFGA